jgi:hypothetical protein
MSWADRLIHLATGGSQPVQREALLTLYKGSAERVACLSDHANQAPTAGMESLLHELAAAEEDIRARLAVALQGHGIDVPPTPAPASEGGHNHWARVVSDLDACRGARDRLLRAGPDLVERDPSLVGLVETMVATLNAQAAGLRTLIARSDPQALN